MTGVADFVLYMKRPYSKDRRKRFLAHFYKHSGGDETARFVVLTWKRTGSNLLCGILHLHPEIIMHNELFNPIDLFTYHPAIFSNFPAPEADAVAVRSQRWTVLTRDLFPEDFLAFIWSGGYPSSSSGVKSLIKPRGKVVGFKSFPDHWSDVRNEAVFSACHP
jgi:hypothetical protein